MVILRQQVVNIPRFTVVIVKNDHLGMNTIVKFYKPSTKTWEKGKITKPLPFNFNEESVDSDECPVMEESCDQISDETNSSSIDAFDEMMHPESQVRSCIYLF